MDTTTTTTTTGTIRCYGARKTGTVACDHCDVNGMRYAPRCCVACERAEARVLAATAEWLATNAR